VTGSAGRAAAGRLRGLFVLADDGPAWRCGPLAQAEAACAGGASAVQLRAKRATDREALALARRIRALTRAAGVLFFVNDRFDLALLAEADGVHLGQEDLPPARLPAEARARLLVGLSTHTREEASAGVRQPVDYLAFGPVFETRSREAAPAARGLAALREAVELAAPLPLVAIGGIGEGQVAAVCAAGAAGVAVISAVAGAPDPLAATRALVLALRAAGSRAP
jgi:thiamine-phosphate pyrophosphorylase